MLHQDNCRVQKPWRPRRLRHGHQLACWIEEAHVTRRRAASRAHCRRKTARRVTRTEVAAKADLAHALSTQAYGREVDEHALEWNHCGERRVSSPLGLDVAERNRLLDPGAGCLDPAQ